MRICHYDFSKPFDIKDGVGVLIVENASKFVQYCNDFILQQFGEDCDFIIDDGDKPFSFKKSGCIVFDFFNLSLNDKKILAGIYDSIAAAVDENYLQEYYELLGKMSGLCDLVAIDAPFDVEYNADLSVQDFLKAMRVGLVEQKTSFVERVVEWLDAKAQFCNVRLFVLVNLRAFLNDEDYALILDHIRYATYSVLMLERNQPNRVKNEPMRIIDNDLCEIVVE